jgi:hypothetical protein
MSLLPLLHRRPAHRWIARPGRALVPVDRFAARAAESRVIAYGLLPSLRIFTLAPRT